MLFNIVLDCFMFSFILQDSNDRSLMKATVFATIVSSTLTAVFCFMVWGSNPYNDIKPLTTIDSDIFFDVNADHYSDAVESIKKGRKMTSKQVNHYCAAVANDLVEEQQEGIEKIGSGLNDPEFLLKTLKFVKRTCAKDFKDRDLVETKAKKPKVKKGK